jgi:hypothetical protein
MDNDSNPGMFSDGFLEGSYTAFLPLDDALFATPGTNTVSAEDSYQLSNMKAATISMFQMEAISPNACPIKIERTYTPSLHSENESQAGSMSLSNSASHSKEDRKKRSSPMKESELLGLNVGEEVKEIKKMRRKEANKEAARRSREKKDKERQELRDSVSQMQSQVDILVDENRMLKNELQQMRQQLQRQQQPMFSAMPFIPMPSEYNQPLLKMVTSYGVLFLMVFSVTLLFTPENGYGSVISNVFASNSNTLLSHGSARMMLSQPGHIHDQPLTTISPNDYHNNAPPSAIGGDDSSCRKQEAV